MCGGSFGSAFTFHNVSINTRSLSYVSLCCVIFTFHNVSINTRSVMPCRSLLLSLHSTMFLLIPSSKELSFHNICSFTFHNVSINTIQYGAKTFMQSHFTFHNVSINTFTGCTLCLPAWSFTFHNVSINTECHHSRSC